MARTGVLLGSVAALLLLSLGGGYGYVHSQADSVVEQTIVKLRPLMQISYSDLSVDLSGNITLKDVSVNPSKGSGGVSVGQIVIDSPGWGYLLSGAQSAGQIVWPSKLQLSLKQLAFNLTPANIILTDQLSASLIPQNRLSETLMMACGGHRSLSMQQFYEVGVESLTGDGQFGFELNPTGKVLQAELSLSFRSLFDLSLATQFKTDLPVVSDTMLAGYPLWLKQAGLAYADRGYNGRRNAYCAGLDDDIVDQYLKLHLDRVAVLLDQEGWQSNSKELLDYQLLVSNSGAVKFEFEPVEPMLFEQLKSIELTRDWRLLNPKVQLGGQWIHLSERAVAATLDEAVARIQTETALRAPGAGSSTGEYAQGNASDKAEIRRQETRAAIRKAVLGSESEPVRDKAYREVSPEQLDRFIGSWVKLQTYYGRKVAGTLERIDGDMLYVDEHTGQGRAIYPINRTKLSGLQVLY